MEIIKVKKSFNADIVFHVLAHMNIGENPSNLYSHAYIDKMKNLKILKDNNRSLEEKIKPLSKIYKDNFHRLYLINFLPFYISDFDELKVTLMTYNKFTIEDIQSFIKPFIEILECEKNYFYLNYWNEEIYKNQNNIKQLEKYLYDNFMPLEPIFKYFNKSVEIFISLTLIRAGRGFIYNGNFGVAVLLAEGAESYYKSFFTAFHEVTHQFTDPLLKGNIDMRDNGHHLSESLVIVADYYLLKALHPSMLEKYLKWVSVISGHEEEEITEVLFLDTFQLTQDVEKKLFTLINDIPNKRGQI